MIQIVSRMRQLNILVSAAALLPMLEFLVSIKSLHINRLNATIVLVRLENGEQIDNIKVCESIFSIMVQFLATQVITIVIFPFSILSSFSREI